MGSDPAGRNHVGEPLTSLRLCALFHRSIRLVCRVCPHHRLFAAASLWWLFERKHWDDRIAVVPDRFYCGECWRLHLAKHRKPHLTICHDPAHGPQFGMPPEREWKRLVRQYRA